MVNCVPNNSRLNCEVLTKFYTCHKRNFEIKSRSTKLQSPIDAAQHTCRHRRRDRRRDPQTDLRKCIPRTGWAHLYVYCCAAVRSIAECHPCAIWLAALCRSSRYTHIIILQSTLDILALSPLHFLCFAKGVDARHSAPGGTSELSGRVLQNHRSWQIHGRFWRCWFDLIRFLSSSTWLRSGFGAGFALCVSIITLFDCAKEHFVFTETRCH
jgi:hypothetical protein